MMRTAILSSVILTLLFAFPHPLQGQGDRQAVLDDIAAKILSSTSADKRELIYIHTDKSGYKTGTTVWFRAYLLNLQDHRPSTLSQKIYVDLVDMNDSVAQRLIMNAKMGEMNGGMPLPPELKDGFYRLRAFSDPIAKASASAVYEKPVYIFKNGTTEKIPLNLPGPSALHATGRKEIHFYPEGGSIINGINCKVALTAFDEQGRPMIITGNLKDDRNTNITGFQSTANGLGLFEFFPSRNRVYTAVVTLPDHSEQRIPLPQMDPYGWQLALVKSDSTSLGFQIGLGDSLYEKKPGSYLLGVAQGKVCFAAMGNAMYEVNVPLSKFPMGPAVFYLFDGEQKKVSERWVFVGRKSYRISIQTGKTNFAAREKVKLDVAVTDPVGRPLKSMLSVSVTDDRYVTLPPHYQGLDNYAFGRFPDFTEKVQSSDFQKWPAGDQDILMMTVTDNVLQGKGVWTKGADSSIEITGRVVDFKSGKPIPGTVLTAFSSQVQMILSDTTDALGNFNFPPLDLYEYTSFLVQLTNQKGNRVDGKIILDPLVAPPVFAPAVSEIPLDPAYREGLIRYSRSEADTFLTGTTRQRLERIAIESDSGRKQVGNKESNQLSRGKRITGEQLDKLGLSNTVNAVMMLPGVIMFNGHLTIRGGLQGVVQNVSDIEPLIVMDGVPVSTNSTVNYLNSIPPNSIDYIEVLTGGEAAQYGTRAGNGVILIKSSNNLRPLPGTGYQAGSVYITTPGFHITPPFYFPPYQVYEVRWAQFRDDRSTIFWNGEWLTDDTGKASAVFYTADPPSTYTICITGITANGDLVNERVKIERK